MGCAGRVRKPKRETFINLSPVPGKPCRYTNCSLHACIIVCSMSNPQICRTITNLATLDLAMHSIIIHKRTYNLTRFALLFLGDQKSGEHGSAWE